MMNPTASDCENISFFPQISKCTQTHTENHAREIVNRDGEIVGRRTSLKKEETSNSHPYSRGIRICYLRFDSKIDKNGNGNFSFQSHEINKMKERSKGNLSKMIKN